MSDTLVAFLKSARGKLPNFGKPIRFLILSAFAFLAIVPAVWALNQIFVFFLSRSYVDQLAVALDVNKNLATAIFWGTFAVAALLTAYCHLILAAQAPARPGRPLGPADRPLADPVARHIGAFL